MQSIRITFEKTQQAFNEAGLHCAAVQMDMVGDRPASHFVGTAAFFGATALGSFNLAAHLPSTEVAKVIKPALVGVGIFATGLAALDAMSAVGIHQLSNQDQTI